MACRGSPYNLFAVLQVWAMWNTTLKLGSEPWKLEFFPPGLTVLAGGDKHRAFWGVRVSQKAPCATWGSPNLLHWMKGASSVSTGACLDLIRP